jgi:hypothetical protein
MIEKLLLFVVCHGGPADHFATFSEKLKKQGYKIQICASGPALKTFQDRKIEVLFPFSLENITPLQENALISQIIQLGAKVDYIVTDVGHTFDIALHQSFAKELPNISTFAYVDNPEAYVPGGYSEIANKVTTIAQKTLFANALLAIDPVLSIPTEQRIPIGYFPTNIPEKISNLRNIEQSTFRAKLLEELDIEDKGQKIVTFFGGNNEEYFQEAFPAFLEFLDEACQKENLSNCIFILQQHPGAKSKNIDGSLLHNFSLKHHYSSTAPRIFISTKTTETMQVISNVALYHQTSMGPIFALCNIPIIQIGKKPYVDILIKAGLCDSATTASTFLASLKKALFMPHQDLSSEQKLTIYEKLGIRNDWDLRLEKCFTQTKDKKTTHP